MLNPVFIVALDSLPSQIAHLVPHGVTLNNHF